MLSHPSSHPLLTIGGTKFYTFIPLSPTISRHPHHPNRDVCVYPYQIPIAFDLGPLPRQPLLRRT